MIDESTTRKIREQLDSAPVVLFIDRSLTTETGLP